jgi:hypothetical protein
MRRAKEAGEKEIRQLEDAVDDLVYLTDQGETPTDALVKVASAAQFSEGMIRLVAAAYNNGVSSEKRASGGSLFERFGDFELADGEAAVRRVHPHRVSDGQKTEKSSSFSFSRFEKSASYSDDGEDDFPLDAYTRDWSGCSPQEMRDMFGLPDEAPEEPLPKKSVSITISLVKRKDEPKREETWDDLVSGQSCCSDSFSLFDLDQGALQLRKEKEKERIGANVAADAAFQKLLLAVKELDAALTHSHMSSEEKRAGLDSIRFYYPDVYQFAEGLLEDYPNRRIKNASADLSRISALHPFVPIAKRINEYARETVRTGLNARGKAAEWEVAEEIWRNRKSLYKSAATIFNVGEWLPTSPSAMKSEISERKRDIRNDLRDEIHNPMQELRIRNIDVQSMLNDFIVNDEILSAYPADDVFAAYNELSRAVPEAMRSKAFARSALQQHLSQGRMAVDEYAPLAKLDAARVKSLTESSNHWEGFDDE